MSDLGRGTLGFLRVGSGKPGSSFELLSFVDEFSLDGAAKSKLEVHSMSS